MFTEQMQSSSGANAGSHSDRRTAKLDSLGQLGLDVKTKYALWRSYKMYAKGYKTTAENLAGEAGRLLADAKERITATDTIRWKPWLRSLEIDYSDAAHLIREATGRQAPGIRAEQKRKRSQKQSAERKRAVASSRKAKASEEDSYPTSSDNGSSSRSGELTGHAGKAPSGSVATPPTKAKSRDAKIEILLGLLERQSEVYLDGLIATLSDTSSTH